MCTCARHVLGIAPSVATTTIVIIPGVSRGARMGGAACCGRLARRGRPSPRLRVAHVHPPRPAPCRPRPLPQRRPCHLVHTHTHMHMHMHMHTLPQRLTPPLTAHSRRTTTAAPPHLRRTSAAPPPHPRFVRHAWEFSVRPFSPLPAATLARQTAALLAAPCVCFDRVEARHAVHGVMRMHGVMHGVPECTMQCTIYNARVTPLLQSAPGGGGPALQPACTRLRHAATGIHARGRGDGRGCGRGDGGGSGSGG